MAWFGEVPSTLRIGSPTASFPDLTHRIVPSPPPAETDATDAVSTDVWGFRDTAFAILPNGSITMTGARYGLSGLELPDLLPWMRQTIGADIQVDDTHD